MKLPHECQTIEEVRREIDEIDKVIIELIGKRFAFVHEIVKYKSNSDDVYARNRYEEVLLKRREMALAHHLNPDIIEDMYRTMMNYLIQEQLELLKKKQK